MTLEEFREFVKKTDANITTVLGKKLDSKNFLICCKKCGSHQVEVQNDYRNSCGSAYTGVWGEETILLLKCKECGNAEEFVHDLDLDDYMVR